MEQIMMINIIIIVIINIVFFIIVFTWLPSKS